MASHATKHFIMQRVTAMIQIPLVIYLVISLVRHAGDTHAEIVEWISSLIPATLFVIFILSIAYHMHLGMNEVIDDYIHKKPTRSSFALMNMLFALLMAAVGLFSIIAITLIA